MRSPSATALTFAPRRIPLGKRLKPPDGGSLWCRRSQNFRASVMTGMAWVPELLHGNCWLRPSGWPTCFTGRGWIPPHAVVPGLDGSVIFEWQDPDGTFREVQIVRPLCAEVMVL